jgi:hypothetical protein
VEVDSVGIVADVRAPRGRLNGTAEESGQGGLVEGRVVEGRVVEGRVVEGREVEGRVVEGRVVELTVDDTCHQHPPVASADVP